jgi:biopolymer transport protein ExbD
VAALTGADDADGDGLGGPLVAINITPFVDVALVLLIIFMATSSALAGAALEVELPQAASGGEAVETTVALALSREGKLFLNGEESDHARVAAYCREAAARNPKVQALIAADGAARHREVVRLIDVVKLNGVSSFALNIDPTALAGAP